jgi:hypothetical protein
MRLSMLVFGSYIVDKKNKHARDFFQLNLMTLARHTERLLLNAKAKAEPHWRFWGLYGRRCALRMP